MIIDAHAHIIVPELTREAAPEEAWRPRVRWEGDRQVIEFGGRQIASATREFVDIDDILEAHAAARVDRVVLCPWVSLLRYDAETEEGLRTSRIQNESLTRLSQRYPQRVSALGTVPLQNPDLAARELEEVMQMPGLCGVEVAASVRGVYLGDDRFRPFWEAAEGTGALVFIHPTTRGFDLPVFNEYYLWNTVGNPLETTISAAHMVMAGILEAYPRLNVLLGNAGGALLSLRGRLRHAHAFQPHARSRLHESPDASMKRFLYDTVTHDLELLRALVEYVGPDHVLLGSDYPFDMGVERPVEMVQALELPPADAGRVLGGNATRVMRLEA